MFVGFAFVETYAWLSLVDEMVDANFGAVIGPPYCFLLVLVSGLFHDKHRCPAREAGLQRFSKKVEIERTSSPQDG